MPPSTWVEVGVGLIFITHSVPNSTLGGGGAHLHHPQCVSLYFGWMWGWGSFASSLYFGWGWGSFASSTVCLPLLWVEVGVGLICIIHSVSPSTLGGGEAHLHHPHCASLYLGESGGRGSFASSTVCLPPHLAEV